MGYKATGKIEKIFDTEQKSGTFQAREFVIEVADGQYPQMVKFQLVQDKCELIDDYAEGDSIDVEFDLRGREWQGRYFTNLQAWRISRAGDGPADAAEAGQKPEPELSKQKVSSDFDDDIPF
ncbi:MAG: DUF3127 domain-containing protein [Granulosicoccus sp.]|nr:DUF3127 domain-containing protein [Granulosicoccus sp.]